MGMRTGCTGSLGMLCVVEAVGFSCLLTMPAVCIRSLLILVCLAVVAISLFTSGKICKFECAVQVDPHSLSCAIPSPQFHTILKFPWRCAFDDAHAKFQRCVT